MGFGAPYIRDLTVYVALGGDEWNFNTVMSYEVASVFRPEILVLGLLKPHIPEQGGFFFYRNWSDDKETTTCQWAERASQVWSQWALLKIGVYPAKASAGLNTVVKHLKSYQLIV